MTGEEKDKFEARIFTMFTNKANRANEIEHLITFLMELPGSLFHVLVRAGQESRSSVANRLYNAVLGEVAEQHTQFDDPSVIAGICKFHMLLPRKQAWAATEEDEIQAARLQNEYEFESLLCKAIINSPDFEANQFVDEDGVFDHDQYLCALYRGYNYAIRSKTLPPKYFRKYLDLVINTWTARGITLNLRPSERQRALYDKETGPHDPE